MRSKIFLAIASLGLGLGCAFLIHATLSAFIASVLITVLGSTIMLIYVITRIMLYFKHRHDVPTAGLRKVELLRLLILVACVVALNALPGKWFFDGMLMAISIIVLFYPVNDTTLWESSDNSSLTRKATFKRLLTSELRRLLLVIPCVAAAIILSEVWFLSALFIVLGLVVLFYPVSNEMLSRLPLIDTNSRKRGVLYKAGSLLAVFPMIAFFIIQSRIAYLSSAQLRLIKENKVAEANEIRTQISLMYSYHVWFMYAAILVAGIGLALMWWGWHSEKTNKV